MSTSFVRVVGAVVVRVGAEPLPRSGLAGVVGLVGVVQKLRCQHPLSRLRRLLLLARAVPAVLL